LPEIGIEGQERLLASRVVVVGCGALGTVQASLLARAGVGELVLIDRDYVEESNLQRQSLFEESDVERVMPKAAAAAEHLARANSACRIRAEVKDLTARNAESLLTPADVIVDGTDNFAARYLVNDVAVKTGTPWVYGAAVGTRGSLMPVIPGETACISCIFPEAPSSRQPTCETAGVLNTLTATIAAMQVTEALKILRGATSALRRRLTSIDLWSGESSSISASSPDAACPTCGRREFKYLEDTTRESAGLCGRNGVQINGTERGVDLERLGAELSRLGPVKSNPYALRFVCAPHELTIFPDGRAIIKGTQDLAVARSLYARYVGN
jgi:adenylyltransferase/sulfurtransferase